MVGTAGDRRVLAHLPEFHVFGYIWASFPPGRPKAQAEFPFRNVPDRSAVAKEIILGHQPFSRTGFIAVSCWCNKGLMSRGHTSNDIGFVVTLMPDFTGTGALEFFTSNTFATPTNLTNAGGTIFTALNEFQCLNASCTSVK